MAGLVGACLWRGGLHQRKALRAQSEEASIVVGAEPPQFPLTAARTGNPADGAGRRVGDWYGHMGPASARGDDPHSYGALSLNFGDYPHNLDPSATSRTISLQRHLTSPPHNQRPLHFRTTRGYAKLSSIGFTKANQLPMTVAGRRGCGSRPQERWRSGGAFPSGKPRHPQRRSCRGLRLRDQAQLVAHPLPSPEAIRGGLDARVLGVDVDALPDLHAQVG